MPCRVDYRTLVHRSSAIRHWSFHTRSCPHLHELAMRAFDLVFSEGIPNENRLLFFIKVRACHPRCCLVLIFRFTEAIVLFECVHHEDAILRVGDLIDIVHNKSPHITVRVGTRWKWKSKQG